jgi:hypothetical protein
MLLAPAERREPAMPKLTQCSKEKTKNNSVSG